MAEALFESVAGWRVSTLAELCRSGGGDIQTGPFGSQLHASDYVAVGIPSVMPQNIGDNCINEEGIARIAPADAQRLSRYLLKEGDIVYSRRGDVTRRALVVREQQGWLCGTGCLRIRVGAAANSRFVSYYLGHPDVREWIMRHAVGATMPNLNTKILGALPIALPPVHVQEAVAEVLGALDDKIAINDRIAATYESLLRLQFEELGIDREGIPEKCVPASRIVDFNPPRRVAVNSEAVYVDMAALPTKFARIKEWIRRPVKSGARFMNGDTLMARITPCLENGKTAYVDFLEEDEIGTGSTEFIVMRSRTPYPLHLSYFLARSSRFRNGAIRNMVGSSGRQRVAAKSLEGFPLQVPNLEALREFDAKAHAAFGHMKSLDSESKALGALRNTLLPKLMSGEIKIRDAEKVVEDAV